MPYTYPLKRGASSRLVYDQNDTPVLWVGDAAWELIVQLNNADTQTYLDDRQAKGVNAIIVELISKLYGDNAPSNINGDAPFTGAAFTTPNETYFAHADWVIEQAADRGIVVLLDPLYLGYDYGTDGWGTDVQAASVADMESWGTYVGNRYKNNTNIVWLIGGDADPTTVWAKMDAFVAALVAADPNHLVTVHWDDESLGSDHTADWLDINNTYTYITTPYEFSKTAYDYAPTMPFFFMEGRYENESGWTRQLLRSQQYYAFLGGAFGAFYGNCPVWHFSAATAGVFCGSLGWAANLDTASNTDQTHSLAIIESVNWWNLTPDWNHTAVTAGYGTWGNTNYVAAAFSTTALIAYLPVGGTVTVDMTEFSTSVKAYWYDPTNGTYTPISGPPLANTGTQDFTQTANNSAGDADWVLILKEYTGAVVGEDAAYNADVTVSSIATGSTGGNCVDNSTSTLWTSSTGGEQTITVDLGTSVSVDTLIMRWGSAYASAYVAEVSDDNVTWRTLRNGTARYVRFTLTEGVDSSKYEVEGLEVYPQ